MKLLSKLAIACLCVAASNAATVMSINSGTFVPPPTGSPVGTQGSFSSGGIVVNENGSTLGNTGRVAVVHLTSPTATAPTITSTTTLSELLGQFALSSTVSTMANPFLNVSINSIDNGNGLAGKNMFVLVGNSSTLLSSTAVLLFNVGAAFPTQVAGNASVPAAAIRTGSPSILWGGTATASGVAAPFAFTNTTTQLALSSVAPVPETSTSLLGALGALALLRRRRN